MVAEGDFVVIHNTMSGRHHGPMVEYTAAGEVGDVFPPTGRTFATTQTHWFRLADGKVIEHWANRDDIGTAKQLGWVPPTPAYLIRMAKWRDAVATRAPAQAPDQPPRRSVVKTSCTVNGAGERPVEGDH